MKCVNKNSKEFKELQNITDMGELALATYIGQWQNLNNSNEYPSYNELMNIADGSIAKYYENPNLELIGTDVQYGQYVKQTNNTSEEGFLDYVSELPITKTTFKNIPSNIYVNTSKIKHNWKEGNTNILDSSSIDEDIKKTYLNNKDYDNVVVSDMINSFMSLDTENISNSALTLLRRITNDNSLGNIKVYIKPELGNNNAEWDSVSNTISISREALSELPADELIRTVLHEVVHAKTASAILEPSTPEEHELLSSVRQFIDSYSSLSNAYGFTNEMEFVAELYSNPTFADEVKRLYDERPVFRNVFQKVLDAIRRLFNMSKPNEFDKLMESVIFNTEISDYRQLYGDYGVFHLHNGKVPSHVGYDNKIDRIRDAVLNNMDNFRKYLVTVKKNSHKNSQTYDNLIEQMNRLEEADGLEKLQLIMSYMKDLKIIAQTALNNTKKLKRNISGSTAYRDLSNIKRLLGFLDAKDYIQELMDYVSDTYISSRDKYTQKNSSELSEEIVNYILNERSNLESITNDYNQILGAINSANKKLAVRIATPLSMNQKVEAEYKQRFTKEYKNSDSLKNTYKTVDIYINKMMDKHKKEISEVLKQRAQELIENPQDDITKIELNLSSYHQVNSGLFDLLKNLTERMDIKMKSAFREWNAKTHKIFKAYNKFNDKINQREKFKNLLKLGNNNKYYLTNKFQHVIMDEYRDVRSKIMDRIYGDNKAFNISNEEHANIEGLVGTQSIFRKDSTHGIEEGDIMNMRKTEGKTSSINAKVSEIKKFGSYNTLSEEDKNLLSKLLGFSSMAEVFNSAYYSNPKSLHSRTNKDVYEYLKDRDNGTLEAIRYIKQEREDVDYSVQPEMLEYYSKYFNETIMERQNYHTDETETYSVYTVKEEYQNEEYNNLSDVEKETLEWAQEALRDSKSAFGYNSLMKSIPNVKLSADAKENLYFYEYPSVDETTLEMRSRGNVKKMIKDQWQRLKTTKNDEIDFGSSTLITNRNTYQAQPNYRNFIEPESISFSFFDVISLEKEQAIKHNVRSQYADKMLIIRDVASGKQYTKREKDKHVLNRNKKKDNIEYFSGQNSNELQKINGLLETNLFDIHSYNDTYLWGTYQSNKIAGLVNGFGASVALTLNEASGVANILNGMAQLHLDAVGGMDFNLKNLTKAEKMYNKDMPGIIADLTKPFKESFSNQIVDYYNVMGGVSLAQQEYLKSSLINKFGSTGMMNMYNEMGEHMMNAVLTMAILDGIKVMDNHGIYLDKKGNRVYDKKEAASLLDMHYIDEKTGLIALHNSVQYTTHTPNDAVSLHTGKSQVSMLIKRRISDMYGDYDPKRNGELAKKWYGKTLLMFKRFYLPGFTHRWKGAKNIFKHPDMMGKDDIEFNTALKRNDEGYYVSWVRMMVNTVPALFKAEGIKYTREYYNNLTEEEQAAIRKTTAELILTFVILPAIGLLLSSSFGDDDDKPYFLMYQVERLSTELGQFYNPLDMTKLVKNPIAGMNVIQNSLKLLKNMATVNLDPSENEHFFDIMSQDRSGNYKIIKSAGRLLPGINRAFVEYNDMYNMMQK